MQKYYMLRCDRIALERASIRATIKVFAVGRCVLMWLIPLSYVSVKNESGMIWYPARFLRFFEILVV